MDRPQLQLRKATPDDLKFIRHSWFESYRRGGHAPDVRYDIYRDWHGRLIDRVLAACGARVAYPADVPDEICGWVCASAGVAHYVYVKQAYRRLGIAAQLLDLTPLTQYTAQTRVGTKIASRRALVFNPYLLVP